MEQLLNHWENHMASKLNEINRKPLATSAVDRRSLLKFGAFGLAAVGAAPLLSACGSSSTSSSAAKSIQLHWSSGDTFLADVVAVQQGIFKDHKLDVGKNVETTSGVQTLQLMTTGAVTAALVDQLITMGAFLKTPKGRRVVQVGQRYPVNSYGVVVSANGGWPDDAASFADKVKSLRGKRVGVTSVGAGSDQQLILALEQVGVKTTDVTHIAVGLAAAGAAQLKAGRLDAYVGYSPSVSEFVAENAGGRVLASFADASAPSLLRSETVGSLVMSEKFVAENKDVVIAYLQAEQDANKWIVDNATAAADLLNQTSFAGKAAAPCEKAISFYVEQVVPKCLPQLKVSRQWFDSMSTIASTLGVVAPNAISYEDFVPALARA